jgi:flagellar assembly protein FliH
MSTPSHIPEAKTPETKPLDETEITRLISAARAEIYRPSERAPLAKGDGFRAKSLMDIARMHQEVGPKAQMHDTVPKDESKATADDEAKVDASYHGTPKDAALSDAADGTSDVTMLGAANLPRELPIQEAEDPASDGDSQDGIGARLADSAGAGGQPAAVDLDLLEQVRAEAFADGRAAAEAEVEAHLTDAIAVLRAAAAALMDPAPDVLSELQSEITDTVLRIASERAGLEIDSMPDAFVERIAAMAEQIHLVTNQPVLRLNPFDHSSIAGLIEGTDILSTMRIIASDELARGDIDLVVDGLRLADRITPVLPSRKVARPAAKPRSGGADT